MFQRYIGIDYSGAGKPTDGRAGLRVYQAKRGEGDQPEEVPSPNTSRSELWSREGIGKWLVEELRKPEPTLVGIDHGFSFPEPYFKKHRLERDWRKFLKDFSQHWPTRELTVQEVRETAYARMRSGCEGWFRLTERLTQGAKSVFNFGVKQGQVATSTHAGLPWLLWISERLDSQIHFWPFDGWDIPNGRSAIAEVYPALWKRHNHAGGDLTPDQRDVHSVAEWLFWADRSGALQSFLKPNLNSEKQTVARLEGWILGVPIFPPPFT